MTIKGLILAFALLPFGALSTNAATEPKALPPSGILPIKESFLRNDKTFLIRRCYSFTMAITAYQQIMRSNPVHGRNPNAGQSLNWVSVSGSFEKFSDDALDAKIDDPLMFMGQYMDAFGPIEVPTSIIETPLYISDKDTCLDENGNGQ